MYVLLMKEVIWNNGQSGAVQEKDSIYKRKKERDKQEPEIESEKCKEKKERSTER